MDSASFFIEPNELWALIGTGRMPQIFDTRRREVYDTAPGILPGADWRDIAEIEHWSAGLDRNRPIVFACRLAHQMSQIPTAHLRGEGYDARVLAGGYAAWIDAKLPLVAKAALDRFAPRQPSLWVTRRRPKIDRVACPWLIRRFLDPDARFLFVDPPFVAPVAHETGGVPFDIEGIELSHEGERCSFDTMLKLFGLEAEPSLARLALIVRGADTARPDLAPEAAGLLAASLGLSRMYRDDLAQLEAGMLLYDAFYRWCRDATDENHNWPAAKPAKAGA